METWRGGGTQPTMGRLWTGRPEGCGVALGLTSNGWLGLEGGVEVYCPLSVTSSHGWPGPALPCVPACLAVLRAGVTVCPDKLKQPEIRVPPSCS